MRVCLAVSVCCLVRSEICIWLLDERANNFLFLPVQLFGDWLMKNNTLYFQLLALKSFKSSLVSPAEGAATFSRGLKLIQESNVVTLTVMMDILFVEMARLHKIMLLFLTS